jgi:hypothetical protein
MRLLREVQRHMGVLNCHGGCVVQLVMDWWCRWWSDGDNTAAVRYATSSTRSACARVTLCAEALKRRNRWRSERTRRFVVESAGLGVHECALPSVAKSAQFFFHTSTRCHACGSPSVMSYSVLSTRRRLSGRPPGSAADADAMLL